MRKTRSLALAAALAVGGLATGSATTAHATGSGTYTCGTYWSYISGSKVHSETYASGSASCTFYKARARAHNVYSSWDTGYTEAYASLTKDPTSNGGTHQFCISAGSCVTRYS